MRENGRREKERARRVNRERKIELRESEEERTRGEMGRKVGC